jgi:hypothetical protein
MTRHSTRFLTTAPQASHVCFVDMIVGRPTFSAHSDLNHLESNAHNAAVWQGLQVAIRKNSNVFRKPSMTGFHAVAIDKHDQFGLEK